LPGWTRFQQSASVAETVDDGRGGRVRKTADGKVGQSLKRGLGLCPLIDSTESTSERIDPILTWLGRPDYATRPEVG